MAGGLMKAERRRRSPNSRAVLFDGTTVILGIGIIVCAFFLFVDQKKYEFLYPLVFIMGTGMNLVMGVKFFKRSEIIRTISLYLAAAIMLIMSIISVLALWI